MSDFLLEIDKYLDNEMSLKEKQAFEEKVNSDPLLLEELKLQRDMRLMYSNEEWVAGDRKMLKNEGAKSLQSFFTSIEATFLKTTISEVIDENRSNIKNRKWYFVAIAAVIATLITVTIFVFKEDNYNTLYAQYIQIDHIPSLVNRGETNNKLIEKAQLLFDRKKYKEAIEVFTAYQKSNSESIDPLCFIYKGICYLEVEEFDDALKEFELLSNSNTLHSKKANWYKAMVYLKQQDRGKLILILKSIVSDKNNFNYNQAQELLEEIN